MRKALVSFSQKYPLELVHQRFSLRCNLSSYLHVGGFEQQVAERRVEGRWQHRVFDVGQLQAQRSQIIGLGLAAVPFGLEEIPVQNHRNAQRAVRMCGNNTYVSMSRLYISLKWSSIIK